MSDKSQTFEEAAAHCAPLFARYVELAQQCGNESARAEAARNAVDQALEDLGWDALNPRHPVGDASIGIGALAGCLAGPEFCALILLGATLGIIELESDAEADPELLEALREAVEELAAAEEAHDACFESAWDAFQDYADCYQHHSPDVDIKDMQP